MSYLALIAGGRGPNVWDKELEISAIDFMDAAKQAVAAAESADGDVISLEQCD